MRDLIDVLRRRWAWGLVGLLLVGASAAGVASASPPTHTYTASVLLLPPEISRVVDPSSPDYTRSNPLFFLGTLGQARDILVGALSSNNVQDLVAESHPGVSYEVSSDVLGTGPIVVLSTEGADEEEASQALDLLLDTTGSRLSEIQGELGIESEARISSHVLTRDVQPTVGHKDRIRSALVVGGALTLVVLFAIGILDSLLEKRRPRPAPRKGRPPGAKGGRR